MGWNGMEWNGMGKAMFGTRGLLVQDIGRRNDLAFFSLLPFPTLLLADVFNSMPLLSQKVPIPSEP